MKRVVLFLLTNIAVMLVLRSVPVFWVSTAF